MHENYFILAGDASFKLNLKVKAAARCDQIDSFIKIDGINYLKMSIKQIPEQGKANLAIIAFFSKFLKLPKSNFTIAQGSSSSFKVLLIKNIELSYLKIKFSSYIQL